MTGHRDTPPPVPVRKPGTGVSQLGASFSRQEAPTLTRTKDGEEERVFCSRSGAVDPARLAKCSSAFRIPSHVYEYLLTCTPETVAHIVGQDGVMTSRPSSTRPDYCRVDFYSSTTSAADAILDRYNQLCGSVMDELMAVRADAGAAAAVHEMAKLFTCAVLTKDSWLKVVCKTDMITDIRQWLAIRTGGTVSDFPVMANDGADADVTDAVVADASRRCFIVCGRCRVEACLSDDIRTLGADVIVTPATALLFSPLAAEGGPLVMVACHDHVRRRGPLRSGELYWSPAGLLPCRQLLHVVLPAEPSSPSSSKIIGRCLKKMDKLYRTILKSIDRPDVQHVAMPLFSEEMKNLDVTMLIQRLINALLHFKRSRKTRDRTVRLSLVSRCESNINTLVNLLDKESERLNTKKKGGQVALRRA